MEILGIQIPDILLYVLTLPLLPVIALILIILWIFRQIVNIYLQIKLGDKYGGLMRSSDKIFLPRNDKSRKIVLDLNFIRSNDKIDVAKIINDILHKKVFNQKSDYLKLTATCHNFLGQDYLLKNDICADDVMKIIPLPTNGTPFDEEYLKRFVGKLINEPLPKNDHGLWEIYTASKPLDKMNTNIDGYVYPFLLRIHHAVADGARNVTWISQLLDGRFDTNYCDKLFQNNSKNNSSTDILIKSVKYFIYILYLVVIAPVFYLNMSYMKQYQKSSLNGTPLTGNKLIAWSTEDDGRYVSMVKDIKNRIPDTRFSDVIFACISASFVEFLKKKNMNIPKNMSTIVPILFIDMSQGASKPVELKNDFSFGFFDMPPVDPYNILDGLQEVKKHANRMRRSPEKDIIYWLNNYIIAVIPRTLNKLLINTRPYTFSISSLPGTSHIKLFKQDLLNLICCAPHTNQTGITLTLITYDNKFNSCLYVDKAFISKQQDVQFIVDGVIRNVRRLNEEILGKYKK